MPKKRRKKPSIPCSTTKDQTATYRSVADLETFPTSVKKEILAPLSSIRNDQNSIQRSCHQRAVILDQILQRSISHPGSGFDESWELIGADSIDGLSLKKLKKNKSNNSLRRLLENKFKNNATNSKNNNKLRVKLSSSCSSSSSSSNASGYSSCGFSPDNVHVKVLTRWKIWGLFEGYLRLGI